MRLNIRLNHASTFLLTLAAFSLTACGGNGYEDDGDNPPASRIIDLSGATGNLPLATAQDAGRAALAAKIFSDTATSFVVSTSGSQTKAAQPCQNGGTRESTTSGIPPVTSIRVINCLDGTSFSDGLLSIRISNPAPSGQDSLITFGEPNSALLTEARAPADYIRFLLDGTVDSAVSLNSGQVTGFDAVLDMKGRVEDLSGTPGVNFGLEQLEISADISGNTYLVEEAGAFRVSGNCGSGQATISTPTDLVINRTTGAITGGQLMISNALTATATITFNANESVNIVTSAGVDVIVTKAQLEAYCDI